MVWYGSHLIIRMQAWAVVSPSYLIKIHHFCKNIIFAKMTINQPVSRQICSPPDYNKSASHKKKLVLGEGQQSVRTGSGMTVNIVSKDCVLKYNFDKVNCTVLRTTASLIIFPHEMRTLCAESDSGREQENQFNETVYPTLWQRTPPKEVSQWRLLCIPTCLNGISSRRSCHLTLF